MTYVVNAIGIVLVIAFIAVFCFVLDRPFGTILFYWFYALHLASNRDRFVRGYRYFSRTVGVLMIVVIIGSLTLRALE
jgi:hypothetical protein